MPVEPAGSLRPWTLAEIANMRVRTADVRHGQHPVHAREVDQNMMDRAFLVAWGQKENFIDLCVGNSALWTDSTDPGNPVTRLSRQLPDIVVGRHPAGDPDMVATKVLEMRGHPGGGGGQDDAAGMPSYTEAHVKIFYEQPTYVLESDANSGGDERRRFISPPQSTQGELETIGPFPGGCFKYVTSDGLGAHGTPVAFNFSFMRSVERFFVTWHNCPWGLYANGGALWNRCKFGDKVGGVADGIGYEGTVNKLDLALSGIERTYGAGTLLLERVEPVLRRRQQALRGTFGLMYDFKFHFAHAPRGWLKLLLWNPATPSQSNWHYVTNDGTYQIPETMPDRVGLYNCRDHNKLWDPNW